MREQQCAPHPPVRRMLKLFKQVPRPPTDRQPLPLEPSGGEHAETSRDFDQTRPRHLVMGSDKSIGWWKPRFQQLSPAMLEPRHQFGASATIEFAIIMMAAMLRDVVPRIFQKITNQWLV